MPIDYKRYPPNWKTEIVPSVLERAGNCCEFCGLPNKSTVFSCRKQFKDNSGRYVWQSIWFSVLDDAKRFMGIMKEQYFFATQIKSVKVILTVAHLDHDETNHDVSIDRLKALCQLCHLKYDAKEKYMRINFKNKNT